MGRIKPLRIGSLFSGIGGLELGFERAGMQLAFQVETDIYAQKILAKHWPDVPRFTDVRTVSAKDLPVCDVLCGGFPCQDISNAGSRAGITGSRSGLWAEFARLIRELHPSYVVVENSHALRSRGLGVVLGDLASCGYDAEWDCLPAAAFGADHIRDRLFIVAYPYGGRRGEERVFGMGSPLGIRGAHPRHASAIADAGCNAGNSGRQRADKGRVPEPGLVRVTHGIPSRMDKLRIKALGNAVHPAVSEFVGRIVVRHWLASTFADRKP